MNRGRVVLRGLKAVGQVLAWLSGKPTFRAVFVSAGIGLSLVWSMLEWAELTFIIPVAVVIAICFEIIRDDEARLRARSELDIRPRKKPTLDQVTGSLLAATVGLILIPIAGGRFLQKQLDWLADASPVVWGAPAVSSLIVLLVLWGFSWYRAKQSAGRAENPSPDGVRPQGYRRS